MLTDADANLIRNLDGHDEDIAGAAARPASACP
jgi:hypothetical protein